MSPVEGQCLSAGRIAQKDSPYLGILVERNRVGAGDIDECQVIAIRNLHRAPFGGIAPIAADRRRPCDVVGVGPACGERQAYP